MRIVLFYHSLRSDWNHGNSHFLRGVASELMGRGHQVQIYEPVESWSYQNLIADHGSIAAEAYREAYPNLWSTRYELESIRLREILEPADLVIVHEWNKPELVQRVGRLRAAIRTFKLLFHDTHHRAVTAPQDMDKYDLSCYDGVLAFGETLSRIYLERRWTDRVWTWHEAADTRVFHPVHSGGKEGDLVWIGNWGDDERSAEIKEFLLDPIRGLKLSARIYGVRYPDHAVEALQLSGAQYAGWLPNHRVPEVFSSYRATVHIPRRPYAESLRGVPTIRVFEALACGIPLVSAPWEDSEHLFAPGKDFLMARTGHEMQKHLSAVLSDPGLARELASHGLETVSRRHTCAHRVAELMSICDELGLPAGSPAFAPAEVVA